MFDYDTVINLTSATTLQQQDYKLAISKREEALKNDSLKSNESTLSINKAFKAKFNDIFEEDQLNEFYKTQIDKEYVDLIATEEFERLIFKFDFPEDYLSTIKKRFLDFEFEKQLAEKKYSFDEKASKSESIKITKKLNSWRNKRVSFVEKSIIDWGRLSSRYEILDEYRQTYIDYHFYLKLNKIDSSKAISNRIKELQTSNEVKEIITQITKVETDFVKSKCTVIQKYDETEISFATEKLEDYLSGFLYRKLNRDLSIALKRNPDKYCNYLREKISIKKGANDSLVKARRKTSFISKAQALSIDSLKAVQILSLIDKRKLDLKSLKRKQQEADEMSELFESTAVKTRTEIKREFSKNLAQLISRYQFIALFRNIFDKNVSEKTQTRLADLQKSYKLNNKQSQEIEMFISEFYLYMIATSEYYSYETKLRKQKLSALRFTYDRKFKELLDRLGIKQKPSFQANNRTFLWEN
jgi:copper chaperone CopZ